MDPGFPVGGVHPLGEVWTSDMGIFLLKMYVKTKELGLIGGGMRPACPLDPPMLIVQIRTSGSNMCRVPTDVS